MATANSTLGVDASLPHVIFAGDTIGICIAFPISGWHTFINFTCFYVFFLDDLSENENMMAYGYEMEKRTTSISYDSMMAFDKDLADFGITPKTFLWGIHHIVRSYIRGITAFPILPSLSSVLPAIEKDALDTLKARSHIRCAGLRCTVLRCVALVLVELVETEKCFY